MWLMKDRSRFATTAALLSDCRTCNPDFRTLGSRIESGRGAFVFVQHAVLWSPLVYYLIGWSIYLPRFLALMRNPGDGLPTLARLAVWANLLSTSAML